MLVDLINKNYKALSDADLYSLKCIVEIGKAIEKMSIEQLASQCDTSKSSILRLTQKLGFSGYSEFKNYIKWESPKSVTDVEICSDIKADFNNTCIHLENSNQLREIAQLIKDSNQVLVYGTGQAQRYCAMEFQRLFMQINMFIMWVRAMNSDYWQKG